MKPIIYSKLALPWNWTTSVDLISPLGVQCEPGIAPNAEVYFLDTHISYIVGKVKPPVAKVKTRTGVISPPGAVTRQVIPFCSSTNPAERVYTQKEVLKDITDSGVSAGLEIPSAGGVIKRQCLRINRKDFDIPPELEEQGYLDGCTHVLVDNMACSNWPGIMRRFNVKIPSLTRIIRNDLVREGILRRSELPKPQRMRSFLQMRSVVGMDIDTRKTLGYTFILTNDVEKTEFSEHLAKSISKDKFFKDVASPRALSGINIDGHVDEPRAYLLMKRQIPMILRLGPEWVK